jgi:putative transposase
VAIPVDRRAVVHFLTSELSRSERSACALVAQPRSTQRHESTRQDDPSLCPRLVELAHERRRFGYPRLHMMLRREGFEVGRRRICLVRCPISLDTSLGAECS